jgi:hypothetical protein
MTDKSLVLLGEADKALALATTVPELKDLRDTFTAAKAWAKSRGLGVEAENKASECILRTERKIGAELIRMAAAGERAMPGNWKVRDGGTEQNVSADAFLTLPELGIDRVDSQNWQRCARISDDAFERMIEAAQLTRERIAKINFYRVPKDPEAPDPETPENKGFANFQRGAQALLGWKNGEATKNELMQLPDDELVTLRALVQALVNAYGEAVKARRG